MGMIMHDDVPYGAGTSYTQGTGIVINNNVIAVDADNTPTENSEKPVKSKGVHSALEANREESASLLKSTVGWTGKNEFPITITSVKENNTVGSWSGNAYTLNGITYTLSEDGKGNVTEIDVDGTSTGNVALILVPYKEYSGDKIISGCNGGSSTTYELLMMSTSTSGDLHCYNGDTSITPLSDRNYQARILVKSGQTLSHQKFYPMLRDASITDDTYEPYHESVEEVVEQIYADNGVLGAKNLMHYPYNELKTSVDVTLTVDSDGVINLNGTQGSSAQGQYYLSRRFNYDLQLPAGTYKLTGGFSDAWLDIGVNNVTGDASQGSTTLGQDRGNGFTFTLTKLSDIQVILFIDKKKTFSNKKIYPMIRLASDPDDTYAPYAMTNRKLTEAIETIPTVNNGQLTIQQNGTNKATFTANQSGNVTANIVTDDWVATGTVSSGSVSFSGIDDSGNYGYKPFAEVTASSTNKNPSAQISTLSGTGTSSMSVTYTTDADNGTTVKLRRIK